MKRIAMPSLSKTWALTGVGAKTAIARGATMAKDSKEFKRNRGMCSLRCFVAYWYGGH
ncbi:hypothetical protein GCM10023155_13960 [Bremerella cremea]